MTHYPTISTANTIIRLTATLDTNYKVHKEQQFQHHLQIAPLFALLWYVMWICCMGFFESSTLKLSIQIKVTNPLFVLDCRDRGRVRMLSAQGWYNPQTQPRAAASCLGTQLPTLVPRMFTRQACTWFGSDFFWQTSNAHPLELPLLCDNISQPRPLYAILRNSLLTLGWHLTINKPVTNSVVPMSF